MTRNMKTSSSILLVTSPIDPESVERVRFSKWGGCRKCLTKPFQVKEIVSDGKHQLHLEGITKRRLKTFYENPGSSDRAFYFYPNDIVTFLDKRGSYPIRRAIAHFEEFVGKEYNEILANLYFCFVDFDPKGNTEEEVELSRKSFLDRVRGFDLPPDVLVDSGYGIHAYWSIKPIHVLREYYEDPHPAIDKFDKIQKALARHFECDSTSATSKPRPLRIPGTWNMKLSKKRLCRLIQGDLVLARCNPKYTLEQIYSFLKREKIIGRKKAARRTRYPRPQYDGWREAMLLVQEHFDLGRLSEQFKRSFKVYFGHLRLNYIFEGARLRKVLGTNGKEIKKARDQFIDLGLIKIESESDFKRRLAASIVFTDLFYEICKIERKKWSIPPDVRQRVIDEVVHSECPAGKRREFLRLRLNKLILDGGIRNPEYLSELLTEWIHNRPVGLPRDTDEINWLIKNNRYLNKEEDSEQDI